MVALATPAWEIALRSAAVYLALFGGLRLLGKREIGQMTMFDLILVLLLANAVQNAMVGPDTSLVGGLVAAGVLLAANRLFAAARLRSPLLGRLLEGHPTVLVEHGRFVTGHLRWEGLAHEDVEMAMREHGLDDLAKVRLAVLETDGSISIVPADVPTMHTPRHRVRALRKRA